MQHINPFRKWSWWTALPLLAAFLSTLTLPAQPVLVKDINPNAESGGSSSPTHLCNVNGTLFFVAEDGTNGAELWKSDGTESGTVLVRNIHPSTSGKGPHSLTNVNGTLYFVADDGASGSELWKSDGTAAGTVRLKDIENSALEFEYDITNLTDVNGTLFFTAFQRQTGWELWKSNGTEAGTVLVKNINPLYDSQQKAGSGSNASSFAVLDGTLYFVADNGDSGIDLWKSDGTEAGTVMVTDFPGPVSSVSGVGGALYLLVQDGAGGTGLWKSNGTEIGTVFLGRFTTIYNNYFSRFVVIDDVLYFAANDGTWGMELWRSDGTAAGTMLVKDLVPGLSPSYPNDLVSFNGALYFTASHANGRRDVWKSDGTEAGTVSLQDMADFSGGFYPGSLVPARNALYFDAHHPTHGRELWKSDGTASGTTMVKNIGPGGFDSNAYYLTDVNGTLYFTANDGNEVELWKTNGTEAGTRRVKNIRPGSGNARLSKLTEVNGTLFFVSGAPGTGRGALWKSNGTATTTQLLKEYAANFYSAPNHLTDVNGTLYFTAEDQASGLEVWKSDGTPAGTVLLKDIAPGLSGSSPSGLVNAGGTLYFSASDGNGGPPQLWKSDGTAAGTILVQHRASPVQASSPQNLVAVGSTVFFTATGHHGRELWKSDGTAAGTVQVKDINPGTVDAFSWYNTNVVWNYLSPLVAVNGTVFFVADDGVHGNELWKSDGTQAGTVLVKDINPGPAGANAYNLTAVNGTLYLVADDGEHAYELWKSDGTQAGTMLVKDTWPGPGNSGYFYQLVDVNGTLFFNVMAQYPNSFNTRIWKSDGTTEGTTFIDKPNYEWAFNLAAVNGVLYFSASDFYGTNPGNELWRTDGTVAGTSLVSDLAPGQASSVPENLTNAGNVLYFTANDGTHGTELWKYDPAACLAPDAALAVTGSTVCKGNPATVQVKRVQPGVSYRLYLGNNPVGDAKTGTGDLTFTLPADLLVAATYVVQVKAAGCTEVVLAQSALVQVLDPVVAPVAADVAIRAGDAALLTAGGAPAGSTYRWYAAAVGGSPLATGAAFTTPNLWARATYYVSVYRVAGCESGRTPVTVAITGGSQFRINAGGEVFTTPEGRAFAADTYFSGGRVTAVAAGEVAGTTADALYRNQRVGEFAYQLPTGNGQFDVTLHFNETYWGNLAAGGIGSRRFHVAIEGSARLTDYDIFAKAGGAMRAVTETFRVLVTDGTLNIHFSKGLADNPIVAAIEAVPVSSGLRVNAGGGTYTTGGGKTFQADTYYSGGSLSALAAGDVAGTVDDPLYLTGRHGVFAYHVPVSNGAYEVTLHFNETYWGHQAVGGAGSRRFHVDAEGARRLTDYDIFAKAGGAMRAVTETFRVTVTDGTLNIHFSKGLADNPRVAAVEVVPASPADLRVNAGGPAYTTAGGAAFAADAYFTGGSVSGIASGEVAGTTEDGLYRNMRFGPSFSYNLPAGNGTYDVVLHFNETYWGHRAAGGVGSRRFNVDIEGSYRLTNYDVFAVAGGAMKARTETFRVLVTDGTLNIHFSKGLADNPCLAALEVVPVTASRVAAAGSRETSNGAVLYPNPVRDKLYVALDGSAEGVQGTTLTDALGVARLVNGHRVTDARTLEVDVRNLRPGAYLLAITRADQTRLLRFVKQ